MHWSIVPLVVLLITVLLSLLLVNDYETFSPMYNTAYFRTCPDGYVSMPDDQCCPSENYSSLDYTCSSIPLNTSDAITGVTGPSEPRSPPAPCTNNYDKWLQMPICKQTTRGFIAYQPPTIENFGTDEGSYGSAAIPEPITTPLALAHGEYINAFNQSGAGNLNLNLSGYSGLPRSNAQLTSPTLNVSMYEGKLIVPNSTSTFGAYIYNGQAYLVNPISIFNDYASIVLPIGQNYTNLGTAVPQTATGTNIPPIQYQKWYIQSEMNPLFQYNGQLISRADQVPNSVPTTSTTSSGTTSTAGSTATSTTGSGPSTYTWAFINNGVAYVLYGSDCPNVQPTIIQSSDEAYNLLPTPQTFHQFPKAYKEYWYNSLLPNCNINQLVLQYF